MEDRFKRIIRVAVIIGIALGSGHIVQSNTPQSQRADDQTAKSVPKDIVQLSAELPESTPLAGPHFDQEPALILPGATSLPNPAVHTTLTEPEAQPQAAVQCSSTLDLSAEPGAMIDLSLSSPCHPDQRVVVRHAGLTVTYKTNAAGDLFATIPALRKTAEIAILFHDGSAATASIEIPEADAYRRFGVQWLGAQAFQVNAFEDGANFGDPGHISAANPHRPDPRLLASHGFLSVLGDDQVAAPLLAEIYTYPTAANDIPVLVEAAVTDTTCNRDLVGELIETKAGKVGTSDLSVSMPGCDAVGQYLELKNLPVDTKIAAAD